MQEGPRAALEPVLSTLLSGEQDVALRDVARELGYNSDYLHSDPDLAAEVRARLAQHNKRIRNQRAARWSARITEYCRALAHSREPVTLEAALAQFDITWKVLGDRYPDLAVMLQTAVRSRQQHQRAAIREAQLAHIDAAAGRLHARGIRLSQRAILSEAGLSRYSGATPILRQRLQQWVGDFPWNE